MNGAGCNVLWNSTVKPWWEGDEDGVADAVRLLEAAAATIRAEVHPDQTQRPPYALHLTLARPLRCAASRCAGYTPFAPDTVCSGSGGLGTPGGGAAGQHSLCGEQGRRRLRRKLEAAHFVPQWAVLPPPLRPHTLASTLTNAHPTAHTTAHARTNDHATACAHAHARTQTGWHGSCSGPWPRHWPRSLILCFDGADMDVLHST